VDLVEEEGIQEEKKRFEVSAFFSLHRAGANNDIVHAKKSN